MSKIIHAENFYATFFEKSFVSKEYLDIKFKNTSIENSRQYTQASISVFNLFPNYLSPKFSKDKSCNIINQKPGFAINIEQYSSIETYLKKECKTNFRKVVTRSVKRLETCFNISYKMYFGDINDANYNFLMNCLYEMIKVRFQKREGRNRVLENWDYYKKIAFNNIHKKKASLFVIYNNDEPIEISLNFHCNDIMYSSISSFNLDYTKFSLGNIEIYKQLEWCINNNISFFDMGYGDFEYKRRWSNYIYNFETHVIASKHNIVAKFHLIYLKTKIKLINFLISKRANNLFYNILDKLKGIKIEENDLEYTISNIEMLPENINIINYHEKEYSFLKKPIYDFLYKNAESFNNISVYALNSNKGTYIVKGSKSIIQLNF